MKSCQMVVVILFFLCIKKFMLFETLAIRNGRILNLDYHQRRYQNALAYLRSLGMPVDPRLVDLVNVVGDVPNCSGLLRCRLDYDGVRVRLGYFEYAPRRIERFRLVFADLDYGYKFADRVALNGLYEQRRGCDEVVIVNRGFVSDCSIGNLLFLRAGVWYTPDTPLLMGTQRAYLLDRQLIRLACIEEKDLWHYQRVMMINALNPFDEARSVGIERVVV